MGRPTKIQSLTKREQELRAELQRIALQRQEEAKTRLLEAMRRSEFPDGRYVIVVEGSRVAFEGEAIPKPKPGETKSDIYRRMRAQGIPVSQIAERMNTSRGAVYRAIRKNGKGTEAKPATPPEPS